MKTLPEMTAVESSHVDAIGARGEDLFVRFKGGGVYKYKGAGHLATDGLKAPSVGRWFHSTVKGKFHHTAIDA